MLPFLSRLKREDFKSLKGLEKKTFNTVNFAIKVYEIDFKPSRFSVVVPVGFSKKAIERNKIKRQIKGIILENIKNFKDGLAVVFYVKKEIKKVSFEDMKKDLDFLFRKTKILK
ncbi:ribonuclease P protein component [Patescibacteria group bacterium]